MASLPPVLPVRGPDPTSDWYVRLKPAMRMHITHHTALQRGCANVYSHPCLTTDGGWNGAK